MLKALSAAFAAVAVSGCAAGRGAQTPDQGGQKPFGDRCAGLPSKSGRSVIVACDGARFLFVVPGSDWAVEKSPAPPVLVAANNNELNVSVRLADSGETQYGLREHLGAVYRGIAQRMPTLGYQVGEAHFKKMPHGHLVLWYEISTGPKGPPIRMVNAWTSLRRMDRRYLDYHVSWAAPPNDPSWHAAPPAPDPRSWVRELADAFFVSDGKGHTPPQ